MPSSDIPRETSPLTIVTVDARAVFDNYFFLLHDAASRRTALVDCGGADPVIAALEARGWSLDEIWVTHHHWDHVGGIPDLVAKYGAQVIGARHNAPAMPALDRDLAPDGQFDFAGHHVQLIPVEGHADGHVAYYLPAHDALFTGDSLMALGCGRLLDGTAAQMHDSLQRLSALPPETMVYSGHEYTRGNAAFALSIDPDNAALIARARDVERILAAGEFTVPSRLSEELATNPFLRPHDAAIRAQLGLKEAKDVDVFAEMRARKDRF